MYRYDLSNWGTAMETEIQKIPIDIAHETLIAAREIIDLGLKEITADPVSAKCVVEILNGKNPRFEPALHSVEPSQKILLAEARRLARRRHTRTKFLPEYVFGEPVWDVLIDLYIAEGIERRISVSSACLAAGVPPTTALRYITMMTVKGIIVRTPSLTDERIVYLSLSAETRTSINRYLAAILRNNV
jgi:DNA-binding MarR family transcriptional regulator